MLSLTKKLLFALIASTIVSACGGGGGGSSPAPAAQQQQSTTQSSTSNSSSSNSNHSNILSPMPGTFYAAPSPEADLFVKAGDTVNKGDTLCIIEAMKIMNEIEAESAGIISEVLIKNGDPVEYNQPLFKIKSS